MLFPFFLLRSKGDSQNCFRLYFKPLALSNEDFSSRYSYDLVSPIFKRRSPSSKFLLSYFLLKQPIKTYLLSDTLTRLLEVRNERIYSYLYQFSSMAFLLKYIFFQRHNLFFKHLMMSFF